MSVEITTSAMTWPPQRFYWAVLDCAALPRRGRSLRYRQLEHLLDAHVPVPVESLHIVALPLSDDRILLCAAPQDALAELPDTILSLTPDAWPPPTPADVRNQCELPQLNLRSGRYTSPVVQKVRARFVRLAVMIVLCAGTLLALGMVRREAMLNDQAAALDAAVTGIHRQILGAEALAAVQPASIQLIAEMRRLEQTRSEDTATSLKLRSALATLQSILRRTDSGIHVTTETLSVLPESATLRASVPADEVEQLLDRLQAWAGWMRSQPEIIRRGESTTVTLQFTRAEEEQLAQR